MSLTFEGQAFATLKAFGDAYPAYRSFRALARDPAIQTIAQMERAIAAGRAQGKARATATARRIGITTYSAAAPSRRTR